MGYTTDFEGEIRIEPPLNEHETAYLKRFSETRHMDRTKGPFYTGTGFAGQDRELDIIDHNSPHPTQPGLWCNWEPTDDGTAIRWNETEKFYASPAWMRYVISTFLVAELQGADPLPSEYVIPDEFKHFTRDHVLNGVIKAQGEDPDDLWWLVVRDNSVSVTYEDPSDDNTSDGVQ